MTVPAGLVLRDIRKAFASVVAIDGVDVEVKSGEFLTILGPSGSGKTTLLKIIAGFEIPEEGHVLLGGVTSPSQLPQGAMSGWCFRTMRCSRIWTCAGISH